MAFIAPLAAAIGPVMGALSAVAGIAGTGLSVVGAIQQGNAAKAAATYNSQVAQQNAQMAEDQAAVKASESYRQTRQKLAASRAASLQNGVSLDGTTGDVLDMGEKYGELDYLTAVYDGQVRATGLRNNAQLYTMEGKSAQNAGYIGAATRAFSGLSDVYRSRQGNFGNGSSSVSV